MKTCSAFVLVLGCAILACAGPAGAAPCPNEAFRVGASAGLSGCRAYEQVTPAEKEGASVTEKFAVSASPDGSAIGFFSTVAFAGSPSAPLAIAYRSARSADAWSTAGVDAPQFNDSGIFEFATSAYSPDLSKTLQVSRVAVTPGAIEGGSNVYLRDNLTGQRQLVAARPGDALFEAARNAGGFRVAGGTPDWSTLVIESGPALRDGDPEYLGQQQYGTYVLRDGNLRLIEPPGGPEPEGTVAFGVSRDGSRIAYVNKTINTTGYLYIEIDGSRTVLASASQRKGDKGRRVVGTPQFASSDGRRVYFASGETLTNGPEVEGGSTLYEYDEATGKLADLLPKKPPGGVKFNEVVAQSEEGDYIYFTATAVLAEGATDNERNLYLLHDGQVSFVATVDSNSLNQQASPDGRYLVFNTAVPVTEGGGEAGPFLNVYVYDAAAGSLSCASCIAAQTANSRVGNPEALPTGGPFLRRVVLDDGTVYLQTPEALVPRDVNGRLDVYAWHAGVASLVSTGTGEGPSYFANATPDGSSVFFLTSQQLVPADQDGSVDAYADREGGGLASQYPASAPEPCSGDACRRAAPSPPAPVPAGSSVGGGNSCVAISAAVGEARRQAAGLARGARRAARAAKKGDRGARTQARNLRRRAKATNRRALGLKRRADLCQGAAR